MCSIYLFISMELVEMSFYKIGTVYIFFHIRMTYIILIFDGKYPYLTPTCIRTGRATVYVDTETGPD